MSTETSAPPSSLARPVHDTTHLVFRLTPGAVAPRRRLSGRRRSGRRCRGHALQETPRPRPWRENRPAGEPPSPTTPAPTSSEQSLRRRIPARRSRQPWYAMHPGTRSGTTLSSSPGNPALESPTPSPTSIPPDEASASPILLAQGSRMDAILTLHAVSAIPIAISVPRQPGRTVRPASTAPDHLWRNR